jgi:hypothetical protein
VDTEPFPSLGFSRERSYKASKAFANTLLKLSNEIRSWPRQENDFSELNLQQSFKLDKENSLEVLDKLMQLGAGLRGELSDDLAAAVKDLGIFSAADKEDPALTFVENPKKTDGKPPILWEMMYEGRQENGPDWKQFWGFRFPITHWITSNRTEEIRLRQAFSASHEDLTYTGSEISWIIGKIDGLSHRSLNQAFHDIVEKALCDSLCDSIKISHWWDTCPSGLWLQHYLNQLDCEFDKRTWKREALVSIFNDPHCHYDLLHFACHGLPKISSELLSELWMKVAGEEISLDVSFMASDLRRQSKWSHSDRGSLVFLNACDTGVTKSDWEPPGFPEKWISCQGAIAVIVTLCQVPDNFACAFACKFYEILFQGISDPASVRFRYIAEALLATRRYFMETYNNPLGLAYVLYAVKEAHVCADFVPEGSFI